MCVEKKRRGKCYDAGKSPFDIEGFSCKPFDLHYAKLDALDEKFLESSRTKLLRSVDAEGTFIGLYFNDDGFIAEVTGTSEDEVKAKLHEVKETSLVQMVTSKPETYSVDPVQLFHRNGNANEL